MVRGGEMYDSVAIWPPALSAVTGKSLPKRSLSFWYPGLWTGLF